GNHLTPVESRGIHDGHQASFVHPAVASPDRRACGYSHDAVKIFLPSRGSEPIYAPYIQHYPPDTKAALRWLMNRQPALWRDRQKVNMADELQNRSGR